MIGHPCGQPQCGVNSGEAGGTCYSCRQHFCKKHWRDPSHLCGKTNYDENITPQCIRAENQRLQTIINDLDIAGTAAKLRPGHTILPPKLRLPDLPCGRYNIHVMVEFDDGVRWCARIRHKRVRDHPPLVERPFMQGEIDTLNWMTRNNVAPVPKVYSPIYTHGKADFYFMEFIQGTASNHPIWFGDVPLSHASRTIMDFAKINIQRSQHPLHLVGSIHHDKSTDTHFVGPIYSYDIPYRAPAEFPGPWKTTAEKYRHRLDYMLQDIAAKNIYAWKNPKQWAKAWKVHRWMKDVITAYPPYNVEGDTYVLHEDSNGGHILTERDGSGGNGGAVYGLIDWERASVSCKAEAFASPQCFEGKSFDEGSNELSWAENELSQAYTQLGRPDLAECIHLGRPYQWISRLIEGGQWENWNYLRGLGVALGVDMEDTMSDFLEAQTRRYWPELKSLVDRDLEEKKQRKEQTSGV